MSDAAPVRRAFPGYTTEQLERVVAAAIAVDGQAVRQAMIEEIARRKAGTSQCFVVPQVSITLQRKAAAPLMARKPQEFDTSALPLFGDQAKQGNLFD